MSMHSQVTGALAGLLLLATADAGFVPAPERIATFDNDGCLWSEQPLYFQGYFAVDQIRKMAADHPDWKSTEPFKSVLAGDVDGLMATGTDGIMQFLVTAHSGMTADEFSRSVAHWAATAKHPTTQMRFTQMVFQPMLEYTTISRSPDDTTPRIGLLIHHTDADREFAYDRESHMGRLGTALDAAPQRGWVVVDMKNDWNRVYPDPR